MRSGQSKWAGLIPLVVVLAAGILTVTAQAPGQGAMPPRFPIVRDWSHRYLAYGNASFRAATLSQLQRDPRLAAAWVQRNAVGMLASASAPGRQPWRRDTRTMKRDWAVSLGNVDTSTPVPKEHFPAMWGASFTEPSCEDDFVVFPIRAAAGSSQANIVAFNYLYDNCDKPVPRTMWAYYVGNGRARTSPVLSLDGSEVAFVTNQGGTTAWFNVLKWKKGQGTSPTSPVAPGDGSTVRSLQAYAGSSVRNRRSSPFVDYWRNVAFVGANNGRLYAIRPVFNSTQLPKVIAEVIVSAGSDLTSPVMDPGANRIFVSSGSTLYSYEYSDSPPGFIAKGSYTIPGAGGDSVQDAALVDVDRQRVFWFARYSSVNNKALVIETDYDISNNIIKLAEIGPRSDDYAVRAGAFDDAHYSSSGQSGNLYVCGKRTNDYPTLYMFPFSGGVWQNTSPTTNDNIASVAGECSPLTTFKSLNQDRLFLGFSGTDQIQMWHIPITGTGDRPDATAGGNELYNGGSAGIIVDNRSTTAEHNNIYFQTVLASTACGKKVCAVKLTQSGLQ